MGGSVGGISNTNIHITPSNEMMGERPLPKLLGNIFEILHGYDGGDGRAIHQHPPSPHHDRQSETRSVKSSFLGVLPIQVDSSPLPPSPEPPPIPMRWAFHSTQCSTLALPQEKVTQFQSQNTAWGRVIKCISKFVSN